MISLNLSKKLPILILVTHLPSSNIYSYVIISTLSTLPTIVHNIKQVILFKPHQLPSAASKQYFELTSSVLSTTSKPCFEQSTARFLVCSLIFIEYTTVDLINQKNEQMLCLFVFDWIVKFTEEKLKYRATFLLELCYNRENKN